MLISSINFTEFSHQAVNINFELSLLAVQPPLASLFPISWLIFFITLHSFSQPIFIRCVITLPETIVNGVISTPCFEKAVMVTSSPFLFSSSLSHFHSLISMDRFINTAVVFVLTFTDLYVSNPICVNLLFGVGWLLPPSFFIPC